MKPANKINTKTLVPRCYANGFLGVVGLAKKINRHPNTIWRAVRWPDQFTPTAALIEKALPKDFTHEQSPAA